MYTFIKATCVLCKKNKLDNFEILDDTSLKCLNCDSKGYEIPTLETGVVELEKEMVINYLEEDMDFLYPLMFPIEKMNLNLFLDSENKPDLFKIYFQGNDLSLCGIVREHAYLCLDYIETNEKEFLEFCETFILKYLNLRFEKLTEEQEISMRELLLSNEFKYIKNILEG